MADDSYPIGRLELRRRPLTPEERTALIDAIEAHPANMRAAVEGLSDEQLDTPYRDGGWTVRQVVHHVVDSHVNSYVRFRLAVAEDGASVGAYQQEAWANLPDARSAPPGLSLDLLDALHRRWVTFLRALTPEQCARVIRYPELGEISVDALLEIYGWHAPHHEAHITELRRREGW